MDSAKIMIVEDKTMVAEDCRDCLESLGYTVSSVVASGEESIEKAQADRPDAVLMDIQLRDKMDGIDAAEQIHTRLQIPVVFLSAYSDRKLLERDKRVGSFGYLVKPAKRDDAKKVSCQRYPASHHPIRCSINRYIKKALHANYA